MRERDLDAGILAEMYRQAQESSYRFAAEENCTVSWSRLWNIEPVLFDAQLLELCEQAVREVSGASHRMPSGPLHDAAEVSRAGIPTIGYIPQPNYLLAGPADGCIEKLDPALLHSQIQVFAKLLHAIETMSAGQLKGA